MRPSIIMKYFIVVIALVFFLISCRNNKAANDTYHSPGSSSTLETPLRFVNNNSENKDEIQDDSDDSNKIQEYPDDTYCAEVAYYNPGTGTNSSYTLTIEVEDNEVTQINFPNGGWLDNDHFSDAALDDEGSTSFTSDKGYDYEIKIIGRSGDCLVNVPSAVQCIGMTKYGRRCKNVTDHPNQLCWQHQFKDDENTNDELEEDDTDIENDNDVEQ
jgi:hypothetical protein